MAGCNYSDVIECIQFAFVDFKFEFSANVSEVYCYYYYYYCFLLSFNALTLLVGIRKSIWLVKLSDEVLVWLSVWNEVQIVCLWSSCCHCIPKPHHFLPHLNPDWFYLSGTGLHRLSWKRSC